MIEDKINKKKKKRASSCNYIRRHEGHCVQEYVKFELNNMKSKKKILTEDGMSVNVTKYIV